MEILIEAIVVYAAQFFFIFLKGLQQINVVKQRYVASVLISFCLGVAGLLTIGIIAKAVTQGSHWLTYAGFLIGGPMGIISAIWMEKTYGTRKS
jgi:hypothetical protein